MDSKSGDLWAGIRDDWRLIDSGPEQELYSIGRDPQEAKNLAATEPAVASQITDTLMPFGPRPVRRGRRCRRCSWTPHRS